MTEISSNARVILNLDELENEAKKEPFSFVLKGKQIVMADPGDLAWQTEMGIESEIDWLKAAMNEEDYQFFLATEMPVWKMARLGKAYQEHYGADEPGKADASTSSGATSQS